MTDYRIIEAVDVLFQFLKNDHTLPFGGVLLIMGGDWRQILPIVEGVKGHGVVNYTLKQCPQLWNVTRKFELTENRRAISDPAYAARILAIGDGTNYINEKRKMVHIPGEYIERGGMDKLAEWVFPDVNNHDAVKTAALLTVDNRTALRLNENILKRLDGEERTFLSTDTTDKANGLESDPAVFATETPPGMPPHRLTLKIKAQVVLLRNISVEQGLCNGTRLTIEEFGNDVSFKF